MRTGGTKSFTCCWAYLYIIPMTCRKYIPEMSRCLQRKCRCCRYYNGNNGQRQLRTTAAQRHGNPKQRHAVVMPLRGIENCECELASRCVKLIINWHFPQRLLVRHHDHATHETGNSDLYTKRSVTWCTHKSNQIPRRLLL